MSRTENFNSNSHFRHYIGTFCYFVLGVSTITMAPLSVLIHAMAWTCLLGGANGALRGVEKDDSPRRRDYTITVNPVTVPGTPPPAPGTPLEVPPPPPNPNAVCPTTPFDTIVVGAGMAGLTAANTLKEAGLSYVVLEQSERIGGRMKSIDFGGAKVEEGKYQS